MSLINITCVTKERTEGINHEQTSDGISGGKEGENRFSFSSGANCTWSNAKSGFMHLTY